MLVTGCAGFIGYHVTKALLARGIQVIGVDDINAYYDTSLKRDRLAAIRADAARAEEGLFVCYQEDVADADAMMSIFERHAPEIVIHLAAQAGVRYSLEHPATYIHANITGFYQMLECCRRYTVRHLLYASSSSVYGLNRDMPLAEDQTTAHPVSLYAATKRSNELIAHSYAHLFDIPVTGMRFFSVYGAWGRPDMAYFKFTKDILDGREIDVYNHGDMYRDFTYIDDIVEAVLSLITIPPSRDDSADISVPSASQGPFRILNLGSGKTVHLPTFIQVIEEALSKKAKIRYLPIQPGDVYQTYADVTQLHHLIGEKTTTSIEVGVPQFVTWYKSYYRS